MIRMVFPGLPISVNEAYMTIHKRKGKKVIPLRPMTEEGKAYKRIVMGRIASEYSQEIRSMKIDVVYGLAVQLRMKKLVNAGWPDKAKTRYKKSDASNRLKLLEDAICAACGIDDSQFFTVIIDKMECRQDEPESTTVWLWKEPDDDPLYIMARLRGL
jgi:Holliday junction resolvase RusA-like endonuclease